MILIISDCKGNGCKWELSVNEASLKKATLGERTQKLKL